MTTDDLPIAGLLVNEKEAAAILACSVEVLRNWRWRGIGPRYRKISKMVRYDRRDLAAFIDGGDRQGDAA